MASGSLCGPGMCLAPSCDWAHFPPEAEAPGGRGDVAEPGRQAPACLPRTRLTGDAGSSGTETWAPRPLLSHTSAFLPPFPSLPCQQAATPCDGPRRRHGQGEDS